MIFRPGAVPRYARSQRLQTTKGHFLKLGQVTFIEPEDVEAAHDASIAAHGGAQGVRSRELLVSAVMAPRALWAGAPLYASLAEMAAACAFGLARNHPF